MRISPEVSLHECLYAMGDVSLAQADAEFHGDRKRAFACVLALINEGWATLMQRSPGAARAVPPGKVRHILHQSQNWIGFDVKNVQFFLRATDAGTRAFVTHTSFFEELSKERIPVRRRPPQKRKKRRAR